MICGLSFLLLSLLCTNKGNNPIRKWEIYGYEPFFPARHLQQHTTYKLPALVFSNEYRVEIMRMRGGAFLGEC